MRITTKIKIFTKKNLPESIFLSTQKLYNATIAKSVLYIFNFRARNFKEEKVVDLSYFGNSFKLVINPKNEHLDKWIYVYNSYETTILEEIMKNIKKGDKVLDVGANIGHHSLFMSRLVGEKGTVTAFEPISFLRSQFEKSIKINQIKNIKISSLALGEKESSETIYICESNVAGSSLVNSSKGGKEEFIHVAPLDSLSLTTSFIKIDVEGYEYFVLKGAEETIKRSRPTILLEYSPLYYERTNPTHKKEIITFLRKYNYEIFDLEDSRKKVINDEEFLSSFNKDLRAQTNIICIPG